jgi:hypothetical protein
VSTYAKNFGNDPALTALNNEADLVLASHYPAYSSNWSEPWMSTYPGGLLAYAQDETVNSYHELVQQNPGKPVIFAELGMPTAGKVNAYNPSGAGARGYFDRMNTWAKLPANNCIIMWFEFRDEAWKKTEDSYGPNWGIWNTDGTVKASYADLFENITGTPGGGGGGGAGGGGSGGGTGDGGGTPGGDSDTTDDSKLPDGETAPGESDDPKDPVSKPAAKLKHFTKAPVPKIIGTAAVGKKLKVSTGTWKPKPKFTYQWYAGGKKIKGATKTTYKIAKKYKGKKITVKVTAKRAQYKTTAKMSKASRAVSKK